MLESFASAFVVRDRLHSIHRDIHKVGCLFFPPSLQVNRSDLIKCWCRVAFLILYILLDGDYGFVNRTKLGKQMNTLGITITLSQQVVREIMTVWTEGNQIIRICLIGPRAFI